MHLAFSMKELGNISYVLDISVQHTLTGFSLSKDKYATDLLAKAGMIDCKSCATLVFMKPLFAHENSLPFNQAYQYMHAPIVGHFAAVKRILRYVKLADIFAKPLSIARFSTLTSNLMVCPTPIRLRGNDKEDIIESAKRVGTQ
ncbi:uncharacterized protein LOC114301467 [Camellia sinensis]|uniref:uncharacterized protein LOC114301467 n=1 Tax=Camellia sinensis TaxID=4442 RepID=UPI001036F28A|nr:uncharacterized protein LOC114301467 [Camellia sinensis]